MIADRPDIHTESTVTGVVVKMSLDENSLAHLASVLTDLYTDAEMAVIRELATNARDAHVEAGQTRPIEVTTPTSLSPYLKVKDWGVGLDTDDIRDIYSKYGASTKRDSNDATGMLGLGCKSPLTYTSQFSLVAVKDGVRTVVSVARDDDGIGNMTIVETNLTVEPNSVEITVPARTSNYFSHKAAKFFAYWDPTTVLVDGKPPVSIKENALKISENIWAIKGSSYDRQHTIVMGGVPYPVDNAHWDPSINRTYSIVAFVGIGEVNFPASREALLYTKKTKATIERIDQELEAGLLVAAQVDIDKAGSPIAAVRKAEEWRSMLRNGQTVKFTYRKRDIPETIPAPAGERIVVVQSNSYRLNACSRFGEVPTNILVDGLVVHGYDLASFTPTHKKKLVQYAEDNNIAVTHYVLSNQPIPADWVDPTRIVHWVEINKVKLVYAVSNRYSTRPLGSYKIWTETDTYFCDRQADTIDTTKPVFWTTKDTYGSIDKFVRDYHTKKGFTMVELPSNRVNKFLRDFPMAVKVNREIDRLLRVTTNSLTDAERKALFVQRQRESNQLRALDPTKISDPELKSAIGYAKLVVRQHIVDQLSGLQRLTAGDDTIKYPGYTNPLDRYPLLTQSNISNDHAYLYIDAVIAAEKDNN